MAGMKSGGGRRGSGGAPRRAGGQRTGRAAARPVPQPAAPAGPSRRHLAHILREGAIWNVFVKTTAGPDTAAAVLLEFARMGADDPSGRYSTPLTGRLREALYDGGSVSRADLLHELELAIQAEAARQDAATGAGSTE
jgi:hypothetical protein